MKIETEIELLHDLCRDYAKDLMEIHEWQKAVVEFLDNLNKGISEWSEFQTMEVADLKLKDIADRRNWTLKSLIKDIETLQGKTEYLLNREKSTKKKEEYTIEGGGE